MRQTQRQAQAGRGRYSHRVLQVKEIVAMSKGLQFCRNSSHDCHDETVFELRGHRTKTVEAKHYSSHIRSRVNRTAMGCRLLCARVCASRIRFLTVAALSRKQ